MRQTAKILALSLFFISAFFILADFALAADIQVQIPIPSTGGTQTASFTDFGAYMRTVYQFIIGAVGILAVMVIMWAGFLWMTARGNAEQVGRAKGYIGGAILGLVLTLGSFFILNIINPKLVEMQFPTMPQPAATTTITANLGDLCNQTTLKCATGLSCLATSTGANRCCISPGSNVPCSSRTECCGSHQCLIGGEESTGYCQ